MVQMNKEHALEAVVKQDIEIILEEYCGLGLINLPRTVKNF